MLRLRLSGVFARIADLRFHAHRALQGGDGGAASALACKRMHAGVGAARGRGWRRRVVPRAPALG